MSPLPTKLLMSWEDIGTDHPDVPATCFVEWEEAQPKNLHVDFSALHFVILLHYLYGFCNLHFGLLYNFHFKTRSELRFR